MIAFQKYLNPFETLYFSGNFPPLANYNISKCRGRDVIDRNIP